MPRNDLIKALAFLLVFVVFFEEACFQEVEGALGVAISSR